MNSAKPNESRFFSKETLDIIYEVMAGFSWFMV